MNRLTLCNFAVDETTAEQRSSHRLREAAFCGRCVRAAHLPQSGWKPTDAWPRMDIEVVFTARGKRRHYAPLVQT